MFRLKRKHWCPCRHSFFCSWRFNNKGSYLRYSCYASQDSCFYLTTDMFGWYEVWQSPCLVGKYALQAMLLFSKLNKAFIGYFDPEDIFLKILYINIFRDGVTDISSQEEALIASSVKILWYLPANTCNFTILFTACRDLITDNMAFSRAITAFIALALTFVAQTEGHGFLLRPPSRSTAAWQVCSIASISA